jgi:hypothetical protein
MLRRLIARWRARRLEKIADDYGYLGEEDRAAIQLGREANNHMSTPVQPYDLLPRDRRR